LVLEAVAEAGGLIQGEGRAIGYSKGPTKLTSQFGTEILSKVKALEHLGGGEQSVELSKSRFQGLTVNSFDSTTPAVHTFHAVQLNGVPKEGQTFDCQCGSRRCCLNLQLKTYSKMPDVAARRQQPREDCDRLAYQPVLPQVEARTKPELDRYF